MQSNEGHLHPMTQAIHTIYEIFREIGFDIALGPEVETEFYNFDALNIPADHPARDMHDTFWLKSKDKKVLRTHTSPVQIRYMETHEPPFRIIVPGKVFRNEATDATHEAQFYQVEALVIDKHISVGHLKWTLETFFEKFFGKKVQTRLRPSFFPFVEPGFETDITCFKCDGKGCNICKQTGWIEMGGSGLVHPHVIKSGGLDPEQWQGFAFGFGIDRLVMLKYGIEDVRLIYQPDLRVINQF